MISLSVDSRDATLLIKKLSSEITPTLAKSVLKAANYAGGVIARKVVEIMPGGKGRLAKSFLPAHFVATEGFGSVAAGALSDLVYAQIQDQGGAIYPRTAKRLAIPMTPKAEKRWPRDWPADALSYVPRPDGSALLFERLRNGKDVLQYVLKKSVYVPGQHYLEASADAPRHKHERPTGEPVTRLVARATDP